MKRILAFLKAALLGGVIDGRGKRVGVIISGGNIGIEGFCQIINQRDAS